MWSRNIPNLLMSPLRPAEFVGALMVMSLIRLAVGVVPVTLMAISFFGFNLWALAATSKSSAHDAQAHNLRLDRVYCRVLDLWPLRAVPAGLCSHRENRLTPKLLGLPYTSRQYPGEYRLYPRELI